MQYSEPKIHIKKTQWIAAVATALVLLSVVLSVAAGARGTFPRTSISKDNSLKPDTAQVGDLRGFVEIQDASGAWQSAETGQTLLAGQRVRTGSLSSASLTFYDGSQAFLRANAELSIDQLDAPKDAARTIILTQWSGESDHQVAPNKLEGSHYAVNTAAGVGEAKGTVFHVTVNSDQTARYAVSEGTVAVSSLDTTVLVDAGEVTTLSGDQPPLEPELTFAGQGVVAQTGETWIIDGQTFLTTPETVVTGDPQVGDWVTVAGRILEDGSKVADQITLVSTTPTNQFDLTGVVEVIDAASWTIDGQVIAVSDQTQATDGIVVGDTVRVDGVVLSDGTLQAASIQRIDATLGEPFDFSGVIQAMSADSWLVSDQALVLTPETIVDEGLATGETVQVEGWILSNGAWRAVSIHRVEVTAHPFDFTGALESLDPWTVGGITLETGDWTQIDADLAVGDQVRVEGEVNAEGLWMASSITLVPEPEVKQMVIVGMVTSLEPWIVNGIELSLSDATVVEGDVQVGSLVQATAEQQADGTWLLVSVKVVEVPSGLSECVVVTAAVVTYDGAQIQVEGWPALAIDENAVIEGEIAVEKTVTLQVCFDNALSPHVTQITVAADDTDDTDDTDDEDGEDDDDGGDTQADHKVDVCHKPDKKGGHTINIDSSALPAHLAHGDTEGPCK